MRESFAHSYGRKSSPRENAAKESFIGHFKVENKSLFLEAKNFEELKGIVENRINYYNQKRRYQTLEYLTPKKYLKKWQLGVGKREKNHEELPPDALPLCGWGGCH